MIKNTAVLIFANSSSKDQELKPIPGGSELFELLNKEILQKVENSGLPYFIYSEKEQKGTSFGSRFTHAFQEIFEAGFTEVIAVGNDSPNLKTAHLIKAASCLRQNKTVVGPSLDGGCYLIGLQKSQFNAESFSKLPWQTSQLGPSLELLLKEKHSKFEKLEFLKDIDELNDLRYFLNSTKFISLNLKLFLLSLFACDAKAFGSKNIKKFYSQFNIFFNKGSPQIFPHISI
jgi:hypothetical protein